MLALITRSIIAGQSPSTSTVEVVSIDGDTLTYSTRDGFTARAIRDSITVWELIDCEVDHTHQRARDYVDYCTCAPAPAVAASSAIGTGVSGIDTMGAAPRYRRTGITGTAYRHANGSLCGGCETESHRVACHVGHSADCGV